MTREEAIRQLEWLKNINIITKNENGRRVVDEKPCEAFRMAIEALEQKPKIGHWIVSMDCEGKTRQCTCDLCGYETGKHTWKNPNFCEDCGAKMEGEENEDRSDEA